MISFSGEHDLNTAPELRQRLSQAAKGGDPIVVDLSGAAFIDSSIIGAVLDARREAHAGGRGFAIALSGGAQPVERVLEVTNLATTLPVHATVDEALSEAQAGAPKGSPSR